MKFAKFHDMFLAATRQPPFPYQVAFVESAAAYELVHAPTGAGKTATAILGWLWRRRFAAEELKKVTPRRLVYCLPMRVLVEQTRDAAKDWLKELGLQDEVKIHVLMGGEDAEEWDLSPEADAILIGTQDMLLSRALNRGYGMSRYRWPMHYGLLNNDCLWVLDEIQLMGVGLATSAQLQAFRQRFGSMGDIKTIWMSATLWPPWLETAVDFRDHVPSLSTLHLSPTDYSADGLRERWVAKKPIEKAKANADEPAVVATLVKEKHAKASLTLVVVNTVERARQIYQEIRKLHQPVPPKGHRRRNQTVEPNTPAPDIRLIHSRFRPLERADWLGEPHKPGWLKSAPPPEGRIIVSTQVVEAGVDISAKTLVTELAPWPSLVQRFGRCNRRGEFTKNEPAQIFWIDVPEKLAPPYDEDQLKEAHKYLKELSDAGLKTLNGFFEELSEKDKSKLFPYDPPHVIRRKDFVDLFDTTPDLAGNDIDVSRFIREGDDLDVQVFWREGPPPQGELDSKEARRIAPNRRELCPVPVASFCEFVVKAKKAGYRWDALDGAWKRTTRADIIPGQVFWVPYDEGGYSTELGWDPKTSRVDVVVTPVEEVSNTEEPEYGSDLLSVSGWQSIAEHTKDVLLEVEEIANELKLDANLRRVLRVAARWHDWGKAHDIFQDAIKDDPQGATQRPESRAGKRDIAKASPKLFWRRYTRRHFRHELASALGLLTLLRQGKAPVELTEFELSLQNLTLYLIAAHHGKVRLSIRSMPDEKRPASADTLFARGIWHGDLLRDVELGDGALVSDITLDLSPMQLGRGDDGTPSWAERMVGLRDHPNLGPIKLAYLESLLRAADMRASKKADERARVTHG